MDKPYYNNGRGPNGDPGFGGGFGRSRSDFAWELTREALQQRAELSQITKQLNQQEATSGFGNLYGDARLYAGGSDILSDLMRYGGNAIPLGSNDPGSPQGVTWNLGDGRQQGHALTFGMTRSGKGVCAIIPALLTYTGSMVVIDPKGENAWVTAERRRQLGQRVVILDPWGEVNRRYGSAFGIRERTTRFNPLSALSPRSMEFADDVMLQSDALVIPSGNDPHWPASARELIAGWIAAVVEANPGFGSLRDVRKVLSLQEDDLAAASRAVVDGNPHGLAARKLARFAKASKENGSIRSTALTNTAFLDSTPLLNAMETDASPFHLSELGTSPVTLYLVLPVDKLETHGRWLRLILTQAIREISRLDRPPTLPVLFMLDEMGTVGPLKMVEQAFGLMAGMGIRIWGFLQDLPQLKRDYPQSWETFVSNAALLQALKVTDLTTSNYLSGLFGNSTVERISVDTALGRQRYPGFGSMGDQAFARPVMLEQEIRHFDSGKLVVHMPGLFSGAALLHRSPYFQRSEWRGCYRPLPGNGEMPWTANQDAPVVETVLPSLPAPSPAPAPRSSAPGEYRLPGVIPW